MVNVIPKQNNVVFADKLGMRHEVQPEYWQRFEDAFALEANEFVEAIAKKQRASPVACDWYYCDEDWPVPSAGFVDW